MWYVYKLTNFHGRNGKEVFNFTLPPAYWPAGLRCPPFWTVFSQPFEVFYFCYKIKNFVCILGYSSRGSLCNFSFICLPISLFFVHADMQLSCECYPWIDFSKYGCSGKYINQKRRRINIPLTVLICNAFFVYPSTFLPLSQSVLLILSWKEMKNFFHYHTDDAQKDNWVLAVKRILITLEESGTFRTFLLGKLLYCHNFFFTFTS
jgi:hypothetical protein